MTLFSLGVLGLPHENILSECEVLMLWSLLALTRSHVVVLELARQTDLAEPDPLTATLIFLLRTHQLQLHRSTASAPHMFTSKLNIPVLIRFHPVLCMFLVAGARAHELCTSCQPWTSSKMPQWH